MRRNVVILLVGLLIIGVAGTAFATSNSQDALSKDLDQMPEECVEQHPNMEDMKEMKANCHGIDGMMQGEKMGDHHENMMKGNGHKMMMER